MRQIKVLGGVTNQQIVKAMLKKQEERKAPGMS